MEKIFFGGIHGVGKSTIINELLRNDKKIGYYSFGEGMREIGKTIGILSESKDLYKLPGTERNALIEEARKRFQTICRGELYETLLVDNHFSVYQGEELVKAVEDKDMKFYDKLILMEVPFDTLYQRILNDKKARLVEAFDVGKVKRHAEYEREVAFDLKKRLNLNLLHIQNIDFNQTTQKISEFINMEDK